METLKKITNFVSKYMAVIVIAVAALALFAPNTVSFIKTSYVNTLLGIVMFGMGLTLKPNDFKVVFSRPKDVIIAINDNAPDGIDISWLWDVDFDRFSDESVRSITVSGIRCQDMRLRMKYVDIPSVLEADVEKAIRDRVEDGTGNLYVLVNYTALFSTRNILKKLEGEQK